MNSEEIALDKVVQLFHPTFNDCDRTWIVGSTIWYPVVLGKTPPPSTPDIDIVFHSQEGLDNFVSHACERLVEKFPPIKVDGGVRDRVTLGVTKVAPGGIKIKVDGEGVIDAWALPDGQSIAEHVMGFKYAHEHVACLVGAGPMDVGMLTRLVRPTVYKTKSAEGIDTGWYHS